MDYVFVTDILFDNTLCFQRCNPYLAREPKSSGLFLYQHLSSSSYLADCSTKGLVKKYRCDNIKLDRMATVTHNDHKQDLENRTSTTCYPRITNNERIVGVSLT